MENTKRIVCDCDACKSACMNKPGWFLPGEIEKVADYLKISVQELFNEYLAVDHYCKFEKDTHEEYFIISPATIDFEPGQMFPFYPGGTCVFFKDQKCIIHPVAPFECRQYHHSMKVKDVYEIHCNIALQWTSKKDQIKKLLGQDPVIPTPKAGDFLRMILNIGCKH